MNDKIIISTIFRIHFVMVSFLSFIYLILSVTFILLLNGLYIDSISLPNIKIEKLYIKWNEKIDITVKEAKITTDDDGKSSSFKLKKINNTFKNIALLDTIFEKIVIEKIKYNNVNATFRYINGQDAKLNASSPTFKLESSASFSKTHLKVDIKEFKNFKDEIDLSATAIFDKKAFELTSTIHTDMYNDMSLDIYLHSKRDKFFYSVNSQKNIKDLQNIVNLFDLHDISYWIVDAIEMSDVSLNSAYGWIDYDNMDLAYKNIIVKATVNNLDYTYDTRLDSISTKKTELEFRDGILFIYPKDAYTYNFFLDKSWLKIDFTKEEALLTLKLLFDGKLNQDILSLTETYGISIPILQKTGVLDTELELVINLATEDVTAQGKFFVKEGLIDYLGMDIDIYDTTVYLNKTIITIDKMRAKYEDIASANVKLYFDAKKDKGKLDFSVDTISFMSDSLSLDTDNKPLKISYKISPDNYLLNIDDSIWKLNNKKISIESMRVPFDMQNLIVDIPKTVIKSKELGKAYISGEASLKKDTLNMDIELKKFSYNDFVLDQSSLKLKLLHDKTTSLSSKEKIRLKINSLDSVLSPLRAKIQNGFLNISKTTIDITDMLNTTFTTKYDLNKKTGQIDLKNVQFKDDSVGNIFDNKRASKLYIDASTDKTIISSKEFDAFYIISDDEWRLDLNSLEYIFDKSDILQEYNVTNGNFTLYKKDNEQNIKFAANTNYPYKILVLDNKPVDTYKINGEVDKQSNDVVFNINEHVDVTIDDNIKINAKEAGISIEALLNLLSERSSNANKSDSKNIFVEAKNSYLYIGENRRAISEHLDFQYIDGTATGQMVYAEGLAIFELKDKNFYLHGEKFNHKFMENLFALSKFRRGSLEFAISGTPDVYSGTFHVVNTTVVDYKILNNILAFVNTIPSLVTFSLPGYSTKGLKVKNAYMNFNSKDNVFNITDVYLNSKEIDILGRGTASIKDNKIDLQLNLNTDLGSTLSKVPIVGYIMLNGDTLSTSLKIKGKLDDPKVESLAAEEIIVAPLNIIKRTFMLPYHLITGEK